MQNQSVHATPLPENLNPQIVFFWKAPLRPYKKRAKNVLRFYVAIALLLSTIVFFFGDKILLVPIWALLFLFYTLTITPPPIVENKITKFGIETAGVTMRWEILSHFFFTQRFGYEVLTLVTQEPYSLHAYLVVPTLQIKKQVMEILTEHIMFMDQPQITWSDRAINWLSMLIPDDEDEAPTKTEQTKTVEAAQKNHPWDFFLHGKAAEVPKELETVHIDKTVQSLSHQPQKVTKVISAVPTASDAPPSQVPESLLRRLSEPSATLPRPH